MAEAPRIRVPELGHDVRLPTFDASAQEASFLEETDWSTPARELGRKCMQCFERRITQQSRTIEPGGDLCAAEALLPNKATSLARISCAATIQNQGRIPLHQKRVA